MIVFLNLLLPGLILLEIFLAKRYLKKELFYSINISLLVILAMFSVPIKISGYNYSNWILEYLKTPFLLTSIALFIAGFLIKLKRHKLYLIKEIKKHVMKIIAFILALSFAVGSLSAQVKVACVGNSITEGWHGNPSYVPPLQKLLGTNYIVLNKGKSGATALKKGDVPYWKQSVFSQALKSNADVITIMLGTNDTKSKNWDSYGSEFKSDYAALIDTLKSANKNAQIFPVLPVPVCTDNYGIRNEILKLVISIIKEVANEKGLTIIDANTPLLSFCSYFADGVHPNAAGADTIASVLSRSIPKIVTSVESKMIESPSLFSLSDNYPNPFNKSTTIDYSLAKNTNTEIAVYNLAGKKVATLVNNFQIEGTHKVVWDASEFSAGVYIYQLKTDDFIESKKMYFLN